MEYNEKTFKCMCGCRTEVNFGYDKEDDLLHIDVREKGKTRYGKWRGVVVWKKEVKELRDWLNENSSGL